MSARPSQKSNVGPIDLHHSADGDVLVHPDPAAYEAFLLSQRDAVNLLSEAHRFMSFAEEMKKKIDELFIDIAAWGKREPTVASIFWAPRADDALIAVVAADEDDEGALHDSMAQLDVDLFKKYEFRLQFILFRASEAEGVDSFLDVNAARRIFGAERGSASRSR